MAGDERKAKRVELEHKLKQLESELVRVQKELTTIGAGERLPGLFVVIEVAGLSAVVPAPLVAEIVRLVETTPVPRAPAHVLGTFNYRGEAVLTIDLGRYFGREQEPAIDAHVLVLKTSPALGLVVDRVRTLVEAPLIAEAEAKEGQDARWYASPIVAGVCQHEGELLPLLNVEPFIEESAA